MSLEVSAAAVVVLLFFFDCENKHINSLLKTVGQGFLLLKYAVSRYLFLHTINLCNKKDA